MKQATNIEHVTEATQTIENRNGDLATEKNRQIECPPGRPGWFEN
jgi:hypothetical protein